MTSTPQQRSSGPAFGGSHTPGTHPALLIVDFVSAYVRPDSPLYAGPKVTDVLAAAIDLLAACRAAGVPVVHTNLAYEPGGADGGIFFRKIPGLKVFVRGAEPRLAAFAPGLEPRPGETLITKQFASAFFRTPLAATLTGLGVDTVLIAGQSTSGCVRASALDCCQHGFVPLVVREAVGDRDPVGHEANLFDLQAKYAEVVSLAAARDYLSALPSRRAGDRQA